MILGLSSCAPAVAPQSTAAPPAGPVGDVRRLVVVPSGETRLTMPGAKNADDATVGRVFGEIAKWYPKAALWGVLASVIQRGIDWLTEDGRSSTDGRQVRGISPGTVVADAFTRALVASGRFDEVRMVAREPIGDDRREMDALVRVIVPAWGLVRVREGKPDMMAAYADVRAQIVIQPTSTIVWEHAEDVTHGDRLPLEAFTADSALSRQALLEALERAGQRLANELLYARSGGR